MFNIVQQLLLMTFTIQGSGLQPFVWQKALGIAPHWFIMRESVPGSLSVRGNGNKLYVQSTLDLPGSIPMSLLRSTSMNIVNIP